MQETVKAAASYFYANRSVFDLWPETAQAETGLRINTGRVLRRDRDQRYPLPEDRSRYQDRIVGTDRGDGGILPCEPGLSAAGRD